MIVLKKQRFDFLDFIRGLLLIVMVAYHYTFNLSYFFNYNIDLHSFPLKIVPPFFSALFLFVSGFSSNLSHDSKKRGFYVLFWAAIITLVSFFAAPEAPIYFGILHCIGIMMIFSSFIKRASASFILFWSAAFLILGYCFNSIHTEHNYLLFLGITSTSFASLDFYPLMPHGAYFLLGNYSSRKKIPSFLEYQLKNKIGEAITFLGKNSLKVYLLHQPIFFIIYFLVIKVL